MKRCKKITLLLLILPLISIAQKPQLIFQSGFQSDVVYGSISPNNKLILTIDSKASLILWELKSGRQLQTFNDIHWATFGIDSKSIELYDKALKFRTINFYGETIPNNSIRNSKMYRNGTIIFKDLSEDRFERTWLSPEDQKIIKDKDENTYSYGTISYIANLKYSTKKNLITRYKSGNTIQLYDATSALEVKSLNFSGIDLTILRSDEIKFTQFSNDGNSLVAGNKYSLEVLDINTGKSIYKFKYLLNNSERYQINMANFCDDDKHLLVVTTDDIRLIDLISGKELWKTSAGVGVHEYSTRRSAINFSEDGNLLLVGDNKIFYCLNKKDGRIISKLNGVTQGGIKQLLLEKANLLVIKQDTVMNWNLGYGGLQKITPIDKYQNSYIQTNKNADKFYSYGQEVDERTQKVTVLEKIEGENKFGPSLSIDDKYALSQVDVRTRDAATQEETMVATIFVNDLLNKKILWRRSKIKSAVFANKSLIMAAIPQFAESETRKEIFILDALTGKTIRTINLQDQYHYIRKLNFSPSDAYLQFDTDLGIYIVDMETFKVDKINVQPGQFGYTTNFSTDEKVLYIQGRDNVKYYDIQRKEIIEANESKEVFNLISSEDKTENGRYYFTSEFYGGIVNLWDISKKAIVAKIYSYPKTGDWAVITNDGRFDGSKGAMKNMYFVKEVNVFPLEILYEKFYTPKLLTRLLSNEEFPPIQVVFMDLHKAPIVNINYEQNTRNLIVENDKNPRYTNTTGIAEILVNATADDDKVDEIRLFHNGKAVNLATRGLFVTDNNGSESKKYTINLLPGINKISAIALNSQRTESDPDEIEVNYKANGTAAAVPNKNIGILKGRVDQIDKDATLHLMVVGINAYTEKINPLTYALPDATAFKEEIEKDAKSVLANVKTYFISDAKANSEGIKNALKEIKKNAKPKDVFIFYYAGHGYIHPTTKEFYLVSSDVTDAGESLLKNGIAAKELQNYAVDILAQKQLFILDACQSAGAYEKMLKHDGEQQKSLAVVSRSTGTHWIAASGSTETAKEFSQLGHGAFTYVLLQALKGQASNNKMITVNGLKDFLQIRVPEIVKKYGGNSQLPSSYGFGNDFPVELIK